jgi:hypothetical protein
VRHRPGVAADELDQLAVLVRGFADEAARRMEFLAVKLRAPT